jgi:hypothetical protein
LQRKLDIFFSVIAQDLGGVVARFEQAVLENAQAIESAKANIQGLSAVEQVLERKVESLTGRKRFLSSSLKVLRMELETDEKKIALQTEKRSRLKSEVHLLILC